jgi:1,2-diacylglycerol 3-beta-glucosyltransferase
MTFFVTLFVACSLLYTVSIFLMSRQRPAVFLPDADDLFFVFLLPCLDERLVIGRTLEALLALPGSNFAVMVIDDGSEDGTGDAVRAYDPRRVWMIRRELPEARQGKGRALNAAFRHLRDSGVLGARDPQNVVVVILDADGRIAPNAISEVTPYFNDPRAGAVQIGVRMSNVSDGILARLQDFEFVTFTEIFQRGRERLGSVGLGGNGQFTRLSALESLGDAPWTDCLTEDLDLGVRLLVGGWLNRFCFTSHVSQQAVTRLRPLIRQRSRWFQGHLQCWKRIPLVLFSKLPDRTVFDLLYHLSSPGLVLAISVPMVLFAFSLATVTFASPAGVGHALFARGGLIIGLWYLLTFGLAPIYAFAYWRRDAGTSFPKALLLAHVFNAYSYLWFLAGWIAVWRILTRRRGWSKTARTPDSTEERSPGPSRRTAGLPR